MTNLYIFKSIEHTFCMLHVIPCFHKGKYIHNPNDPLQYFCMLGFLGYEMCLFWKLYVEGFIDSFGEGFFFFLVSVWSRIENSSCILSSFDSHYSAIASPYFTFFSPSMLAWRRISFPLVIWSCTKYFWSRCMIILWLCSCMMFLVCNF